MGWCGRRALLPAVKRVGNRECTITAMRLDGRSMGGVNIRPNVLEAMWLPCLFTIFAEAACSKTCKAAARTNVNWAPDVCHPEPRPYSEGLAAQGMV